MNVVTGLWGNKYEIGYADALREQVRSCGYRLTVLGVDRPIQTRPDSWWPKLELFAPWNADLRPALFIDLDTFILDWNVLTDIEESMDMLSLALITDFNRPDCGESGLFLAPEDPGTIWEGVESGLCRSFRGDGFYLNSFRHDRIDHHVPGIQSYKVHQLYDSPKDARIVCFHGRPNPHETEGWAKEFWITQICQWRNSGDS